MPLVQLGQNFATGRLAQGCLLCRDGAKMVLYLTGDCQSHCWYCPVDRSRMYVDRAFANEREIGPDGIDAALEEARAMRALGAGITGGDPMTHPERVEAFCRAFKAAFGPKFHIHMYTQNVFDPSWVDRLAAAGLDEIRFHPPQGWWSRMDQSPYDPLLRKALASKLRVGAEIPAIPGKEGEILELVRYLDRLGCGFLNLNELEFAPANVDQLTARGFTFLNDASNVVEESRATAQAVVDRAIGERIRMVVHFCASTYKDSVQLRKRFLRRAQNTERPLEAITPDGTLLYGVVEGPEPDAIYARLTNDLGVPLALVQIDHERNRVDVAGWILEKKHARLADLGRSSIVEVHPSATRLEVEKMPLPYPTDDGNAILARRQKRLPN